MNWNFKKMGPAAAASLVAFTAVLNAADDSQMRNLENRVSALEQKKGAGGMINPPARPVVKNGADVFFTAELLVLKAREDDLAYAISMDAAPVANGPNSGSAVHWTGKWAAGVRLGLGYNMGHDGWDAGFYWTHYNTSHSNSTSSGDCCTPCPGFFQPVYFPKDYGYTSSAPNIFVTEAEGKKWKLNLNLIDFELGREFFVSKWMTIRPHVGLRSAWINQKFKAEYEQVTAGDGSNFFTSAITTLLPGAREDFVSMKNNFWGIGLRGGLDANWGLGCGFSFYSKLALGLLVGKFNVNQKHNFHSGTTGNNLLLSSMKNSFRVCRPTADLMFGLRYDTTFSDDSWGLGVNLGWEQHYFWGQNKTFRFDPGSGSMDEHDGDLSVAGAHIGLSFDF